MSIKIKIGKMELNDISFCHNYFFLLTGNTDVYRRATLLQVKQRNWLILKDLTLISYLMV